MINLKNNDVIVPICSEDLLETYKLGTLDIIKKKELPDIGFVGWSNLPLIRYWKTYLKELPTYLLSFFNKKYQVYRKGIFLRSSIIKKLKSSKKLKTNFIERDFFSGNKKTLQIDSEIVRKEFINNIINSQYSLCAKGDANQSTRFFEVLSLGRIPIFIDTDCVLPLEDKIDYRDFCLFIDYKDIDNVEEIIFRFHQNISDEDFENIQRRAREVYVEYLRIDSYTKYLMDILREKTKNGSHK